MTNFIDSKLGIYPQALMLHEKRVELISGNLAHENTPGFKAKDIDFREALRDITDKIAMKNNGTSASDTQKIDVRASMLNHTKYREVSQPSQDGNTVDGKVEHAAFAENSVRYLSALNILNERVKNLMLAIKGSNS